MQALGATLVAISPTLRQFSAEIHAQHHLPFDILSDAHNEVAKRFGLVFTVPDYIKTIYLSFPLDLAAFNGDGSWTLPIPARFVVSRDGVIRKVDADPDYTRRPEPDDTIAALEQLR